MRDEEKTRKRLIHELHELRAKLAFSEATINHSDKIQKDDERYRVVLDALSDFTSLVTIDINGKPTLERFIGDAKRITGYHLAEFDTLDHFGVHPDDVSIIEESIATTLKNVQNSSEYRFRHKDGHYVWLQVVRQPIWDPHQGRVTSYYSIATDITTAKQSEADQHVLNLHFEQQTRSLQLIDNITDLLYRALDFDTVVETVIVYLSDYTEIDTISIYQLDETQEYLHLIGCQGYPEEVVAAIKQLPVKGSLAGIAVQECKVMVMSNAIQDARAFKPATRKMATLGMNGMIAIPLLYRNQVQGIVALVVNDTFDLSVVDTQMLMAIGKMFATVMANARYMQQIQVESTERKQAEEALIEERNLLRTIIDTVPSYIFVTDREGRYIVNNLFYQEFANLPAADLLGKTVFDLLPSAAANRLSREDEHIMQTGQPLMGHENIVDFNGNNRWFLVSKVPLRDRDNNIIGLVGVSIDITERKQAEIAIRNSEKRFAEYAKAQPDRTIIFDQSGRYVNILKKELYPSTLSIEFENREGKLLHDCVPKSQADFYMSVIERAIASGELQIIEYDISDLDTGSITMEGRVAPFIDPTTGEWHVIWIAREITERKRAEAIFVDNQKLQVALEKEQELAELQTRFMTMISHELRTPLASILLAGGILQKHWEKLNEQQRQDKVKTVVSQAVALQEMLNELGLGMRVQRGYLDFQPSTTDLLAVCNQLIELFQIDEDEKHPLRFTNSGILDNVWLDGRLINHALTNLLSNAIKFSPDGGIIDLTVTRTEEALLIEVSDTGIGIPEKDQQRLFDLFFRATNVDTIRGTGLGLSIVKAIVELHGGTITCESKLGVGTTFIVSIPNNQ